MPYIICTEVLQPLDVYTNVNRSVFIDRPSSCLLRKQADLENPKLPLDPQADMLHARSRPIPCTCRADRPASVVQMLSKAAFSRQQLTARHAARCRQCCLQHAATAVSRQLHLATLAGNTLEHQQPQARRHRRRVAVAPAAAGSDSASGDADMEAAARGEISEESEQHPPTLPVLQAALLCRKCSAAMAPPCMLTLQSCQLVQAILG